MNRIVLSAAFLFCTLPSFAFAQERIVRSMSPEDIEALLRGINIEAKKGQSTKEVNVFYYDFRKDKFDIRLTVYSGGKDIMLDIQSGDHSFETVNSWNRRAKFDRAVIYQDSKGKYVALEANLDIAGGVTTDTVKHFMSMFEAECNEFDKFFKETKATTSTVKEPSPTKEEAIYTQVSNEKIEKMLADLKIAFTKTDGNNQTTYSYTTVNNQAVRLVNFAGKDIMLTSSYRKISLENCNKFNYDNKFVRVVEYTDNKGDYTDMEMNLDISGGVNDTIVRNFIVFYEDNVRAFTKYLSNANDVSR